MKEVKYCKYCTNEEAKKHIVFTNGTSECNFCYGSGLKEYLKSKGHKTIW